MTKQEAQHVAKEFERHGFTPAIRRSPISRQWEVTGTVYGVISLLEEAESILANYA